MPDTPSATFKKGDTVSIINRTQGGRFFCEGRATIVRKVRGIDDQYVVRFLDDGSGFDETYERFVDPAAQGGGLEPLLARLNS